MKFLKTTLCALTLLTAHAHAIEWDAKQWEASAGVGFGKIATDGYSANAVFGFGGGVTVPVFVERHTRFAVLLSGLYNLAAAQEAKDAVGGNVISGGVSALIEHDISAQGKTLWYGYGINASGNYKFGQFTYTTENFDSVEIPNEFSPSISFIGRFEYPISNQLSVGAQAQYSPFEHSLTAATINAIFHF